MAIQFRVDAGFEQRVRDTASKLLQDEGQRFYELAYSRSPVLTGYTRANITWVVTRGPDRITLRFGVNDVVDYAMFQELKHRFLTRTLSDALSEAGV